MPKILRNHYVLAVHDLAVSRDWYERVLGCETEEVDPGNWMFFSRDGVCFMCGRCPDATPARDLGDHSYFAYLVVDAVDAFHARAVREGAEVTKTPRDEAWGMHEFGLRTADGHRIMVAQRLND